jgi:hypothetical protein
MELSCDWNIYNDDSLCSRLKKEIKVCFIRAQWRSPYSIFRQIYIFKDHNVWNIWKTMCYSCTHLIIISSEMIFIVFLQNVFKPFLRNKIDPMPLKHLFLYWVNVQYRMPNLKSKYTTSMMLASLFYVYLFVCFFCLFFIYLFIYFGCRNVTLPVDYDVNNHQILAECMDVFGDLIKE